MKDLTRGSIAIHILSMAAPVAISMVAGVAYHLIDLYFVTRLGTEATAGINAAGTATFILSALTQVLGTGTTVLVAHSLGRKDVANTNLLFNQSMVMAVVCGVIAVISVCLLMPPYMRVVSREAGTIAAGTSYIYWVAPAYALLFPMIAMSSTLRGAGVIRPAVFFVSLTVVLNAALAPVFIAGWGTGIALGVKGAGLATSVAIFVGVLCMGLHFSRTQRQFRLERALIYPQLKQWRRILAIGWPAGAEFVLMFLMTGVVYFAIRDQGSTAQAAFAIGSRIMQTLLLAGMSVASAAGPIAGQSYGANDAGRVNEVFRIAALLSSAVMLTTTVLVLFRTPELVGLFGADARTAGGATLFLHVMSWTFVAQGLVYTCAFMFQGIGNTVPSLLSAITRFIVFAGPALWLARQPGFQIEQLWYLLAGSVLLQAVLSLLLLRMELRRRLQPLARPAVAAISSMAR
ncbi:MATE family efflux transporter [Peristeroidobacter soli]|uniref:MATE family efflux transporter n=1 Tax=Peristeroidobacter soli TaxID=2497877 RepID=UPI00130061BE|nr:MATE family efflux transporter [Peristeroidobacter soli]